MCISIIIPSTGERTSILLETVEAALHAIEGFTAEIIVIKKQSKSIDITHPKLRFVDVSFNNVSASRNLGAKYAKCEMLFFIDDDILISSDNVNKLISFAAKTSSPYLLSAVWIHSQQVESLKETTLLGQLLSLNSPNDSFKTRYKNTIGINDWQDNKIFKSEMKTVFWEACFSMRRNDYLQVGGMNEYYDFGNEGSEFLKRLLSQEFEYYVDPTNVVLHNEWNKYSDWNVPEARWRMEAKLVNDGKASISYSNKNYFHKVLYGTIIYAFHVPLGLLLRSASVKKKYLKIYFKIYDIYSTAFYWNTIKWEIIDDRKKNV